jgi:hypothetical protein
MSRIVGFLRAVYNFFAGDAILLAAVAIAFALAFVLVRVHGMPMAVPAVVFVATIVAGLATTLGHEALGRPRR